MPGLTGGRWRCESHGEPERCTRRETGGIEPGRLPPVTEPAAYLTGLQVVEMVAEAISTWGWMQAREPRLVATLRTTTRNASHGPQQAAVANFGRRHWRKVPLKLEVAHTIEEGPGCDRRHHDRTRRKDRRGIDGREVV